MKIASVRIENFRGFKDETIHFNNYSCLVGANGSGKSTVLAALNVFFRQYKDSKTDLSRLSVEDFHHKNVLQPITITVTFVDLSEQAKKDLSDYVRDDKLIVRAVAKYNANDQRAEVIQYGSRLGMEEFRKYFEADKEKANIETLRGIYKELKDEHGLPEAKTKPDMEKALQAFEASSGKSVLIPSADEFYGVTRGKNRLAPHIQWVFVAASKDLTVEGEESSKNSALGLLLARTIRAKVDFAAKIAQLKGNIEKDYQKILDDEQPILNALSVSIELKLRSWAHPAATAKVLWKQDPDKSVKVEEPWAFIRLGERGFESEMARFGHGMQRSCMLSLLQEIAAGDAPGAPTLVMGIEEPELYQHPPQIRYLAEVLQGLSVSGAQMILCTHSPLFIPGDDFESVRLVREKGSPSASFVASVTYDGLAKRLNECGQTLLKHTGMMAKLASTLTPYLSEMFFCRVLILVEGIEDVAYISTYLELEKEMETFRRYGCHIVPVGRKSDFARPLAIAKLLGIPVYTLFDADTDKTNTQEVTTHRAENKVLLAAAGYPKESEWPTADIWKPELTVWANNMGSVVKGEIGAAWQGHFDGACAALGNPGNLHKNPLAVAKALELAWNAGHKAASLTKLVKNIAAFAKTAT